MTLLTKTSNFQYFILFVLIIFISFRYFSTLQKYKDGDKLKITATILSEPIVYSDKQYLKLHGLKVYLPKYPSVTYGDKIVVTGEVENKQTGYTLKNPKLIEITEKQNNLHIFRQKLIDFYKRSLPEPHSSIVSGVVLGSKQMPQQFWQSLKETGTAHIVVASGTNVTMVGVFLISILTYFITRKYAVFIALAGILLYVFLSGFDAPIVRAGIMGSIVFLAQDMGRVVNSWRVLILTSLIMLIFKPIWITDLGFILSFVATSSLMLFQKRINDSLKFIPSLLREGLSTSIAAQIGVAPIIFVTFGQFNILSPIINALILWTIPYVMILGALSGLIGLVAPLIGKTILFVLFPLTWYFTKVISIF